MANKKYSVTSLDSVMELFNSAVEEMAHEVLWNIEHMYETAIDRFYADYNPLYYNRTYSTYLGSSGYDNLFSPQNIFGSQNKWTAGITVDSNYIPGKPYRADTDWVFNRTFAKGIHGIKAGKAFGKDFKKTFTRYIGKNYKTYKVNFSTNNFLKGKGLKKVEVTRHFTSDISIQQREMSNMSPTPKGMIGRDFRKFMQKRNMKRIFNNILDSKFS